MAGIMVLGGALYGGGDIAPVAPVPAPYDCGEGIYVGGALTVQRTFAGPSGWTSYEDGQDKTGALTGVLGYKFNCYLALEGRVGQNLYEEDYADVLTYSIFLKPMYPVTEDLDLYALLGYGVVRVEGTDGKNPAVNIGKTIVDKGSFQWGFGASYEVLEHLSVFLDYTKLMDKQSIPPQRLSVSDTHTWDQISDDTINLGLFYSF
jgi:opacity protein-like surface antigen